MSDYKAQAPNRVLAAAITVVGNELHKQRDELRVNLSAERAIRRNITVLTERRKRLVDAVDREHSEMQICDECEMRVDTVCDPMLHGKCEQCHRDDEREQEKAE